MKNAAHSFSQSNTLPINKVFLNCTYIQLLLSPVYSYITSLSLENDTHSSESL